MVIVGGGWKKLRKKSKFGQKLHDIRRIRRKVRRSRKYFSENRSLGGLKRSLIVGIWVVNFRKNGVGGPPTIRDRRVGVHVLHIFKPWPSMFLKRKTWTSIFQKKRKHGRPCFYWTSSFSAKSSNRPSSIYYKYPFFLYDVNRP